MYIFVCVCVCVCECVCVFVCWLVCRLFNGKSIFMEIITSISNNSLYQEYTV